MDPVHNQQPLSPPLVLRDLTPTAEGSYCLNMTARHVSGGVEVTMDPGVGECDHNDG